MNTLQVQDTELIRNPGSYKYIISATVDTLNKIIYANEGDYVTSGTCLVATLAGDSVTTYSTGISSEALAVDYRIAPAGFDNPTMDHLMLTLFPNPVSEQLTVQLMNQQVIKGIMVTDMMGRMVINKPVDDQKNTATILVNSLPAGLYSVTVRTSDDSFSGKFLKQ